MPSPDTIRLGLVIIAFLCLFGMFLNPFYGLISYLIIMMARPGLYYPILGDLRIELLVGVFIILVIVFLPDRLRRIRIKYDPISKWTFILFGIMILSMFQAFDFKHSWEWMQESIKLLLFFVMIVTLVDTPRQAEVFLLFFAVLTCTIAYDAIYNYMTGVLIKHGEGSDRVDYAVASYGMGSGHVALANLTLQGMPVLWYLGACSKNKVLRCVGAFLFMLCLYAVVISGSRGGFAGILALGACITYFSRRRAIMLAGGAAIMLVIPIISHTGYMDYIGTIIGLSDTSGSSRISGLRNGFDMLLKRPLLGVGPGCYQIARKAWFGWGLWAHNHYGELMGDLGVIGTVVWFIFFKKYFSFSWRFVGKQIKDSLVKNLFLTVVVASIVRLFLGMATHSVYIFFWYMLAGVTCVLSNWYQKQSAKMLIQTKREPIINTHKVIEKL